MKKQLTGILLGGVAGAIDTIPMFLQKLTWDANLSAFIMWLVVGFFIAFLEIKINPILKGILVAVLGLLPSAILIAWKELVTLIPICIMTTVLGALLGWAIHKTTK
jgi:hypothetical protein